MILTPQSAYNARRYQRTPLPDLSQNFATKPGAILPADLAFVEEGQKNGLYGHITPERLAKWKLSAQRNALQQFAPVTNNQSRSMQFAEAQNAAARVERRAAGGRY